MNRSRFQWLLICTAVFAGSHIAAAEWPQWRGPQRDGVWPEDGVITEFDAPQVAIKWRADIASGYSGPTVAEGLVYVSDRLVKPDEIERIHCFQ